TIFRWSNLICFLSMMTGCEIVKMVQRQADQDSVMELILKIRWLIRYLLRKWVLILVVAVVCGALGAVYTLTKETNYTAKLNFIIGEQGSSGGGLGAAASIAAQFGFNLGGLGSSGGFFQGDNIIEFLKSRSMIDQTLLTEVEI